MIPQLPADSNIPPKISTAAAQHGVGTPIMKARNRTIQIFYVIASFILITAMVYLCYIHFWEYINPGIAIVIIILELLTVLYCLARFYLTICATIYICTEGMLSISKKVEKAIRWDEVKAMYTINNRTYGLMGPNKDLMIMIPYSFMTGRNQHISDWITQQVSHYLLPAFLSRYERGEEITYGPLSVTKAGVSKKGSGRAAGMSVEWDDLVALHWERNRLSLYRIDVEKSPEAGITSLTINTGFWHIWIRSDNKRNFMEACIPNLAIFVTLVNTLLDQREKQGEMTASRLHPYREAATIARARDKRKAWRMDFMLVASIIAVILCMYGSIAGYLLYQSNLDQQQISTNQQQIAKAQQLIRNDDAQRAMKPYFVQVPGQGCTPGHAIWINNDTDNSYQCQKDGLLITQKKDFNYRVSEYFSFMSDESWEYGHYIPSHYRVQVTATMVSGGKDTCVVIGVHVQNYAGRQYYMIWGDGSWQFGYSKPQDTANIDVADGMLPHVQKSYVIAVDVTNDTQTLIVDNHTIATMSNSMYSYTDQLELGIFGDQSTSNPPAVRFSDFRYTPYP